MSSTFLFYVPSWLITLVLIPVAVIVYRLGHQLKKRAIRKGRAGIDSPGTIEGSMLGLSALLLAFTFNMSATKFSERQKLIVEEANKIGTALLRCDLYPDSMRNTLRQDFKQYLEARIKYYNTLGYKNELNFEGAIGQVIADVAVQYKSESFLGDHLLIKVGVSDFNKYGFDMYYLVEHKETGREVARGKTGIVCFDYSQRKIARIPETLKEKLQ